MDGSQANDDRKIQIDKQTERTIYLRKIKRDEKRKKNEKDKEEKRKV